MPEGHEHHGVIARAVATMPSGVEESLHLRLGEEVLATAIDGRIPGLAMGFPGHSLPYGSWCSVFRAREAADCLRSDGATYDKRGVL
jgi:hypothetical protein